MESIARFKTMISELTKKSVKKCRRQNLTYCVICGRCIRLRDANGDVYISLHRFPHKNPEMLKKWIQAMGRENWWPAKTSRMCNRHFTKDCFLFSPGSRARFLRRDAVPSIFDQPSMVHHCKRKCGIPLNRSMSTPSISQELNDYLLDDVLKNKHPKNFRMVLPNWESNKVHQICNPMNELDLKTENQRALCERVNKVIADAAHKCQQRGYSIDHNDSDMLAKVLPCDRNNYYSQSGKTSHENGYLTAILQKTEQTASNIVGPLEIANNLNVTGCGVNSIFQNLSPEHMIIVNDIKQETSNSEAETEEEFDSVLTIAVPQFMSMSDKALVPGACVMLKALQHRNVTASPHTCPVIIQEHLDDDTFRVMAMKVFGNDTSYFMALKSYVFNIQKKDIIAVLPEPIIEGYGDEATYQFNLPISIKDCHPL